MSLVENYNPLADPIYQVMDENGMVNEALRPAGLTDDLLLQMYEEMVLTRMADDKVNKLQRQGRMGTYPSMQGQEACQIPIAHNLKKEDWVAPAFRELGIMMMCGVPLVDIYRYWGGFESGSKMPKGVNVLPVSIPVGSQLLHAVGIAWGLKLQKKSGVTVPFFSDGATSTGDFHSALNFAGVYRTATVFLCQNNQYAISTPRAAQTASRTLAEKALAYGFNGIQVDGNDVMAMYAVTKDAIEYARGGGGPVLIEAVTFRQGPHTSSDDPKKYVPAGEREMWMKKDPIARLQKYLQTKNLWSEDLQKEIDVRGAATVEKAVAEYEATPSVQIDELFDYVHAELTPDLAEQKAALQKALYK
ncbi:MAG: pyruvate dehydrogenase (acetyl-transferring) E1 component subunit alpha [Patescibacteria group bacterium]